ncbi:MAG: nicotinate-nucleotide adenylyltransferase [Oliverpabstia sp.]|nr:nicotinate-nucleotide adenylyltransferase [Lachnospiraceae bacterium]MDY5027369.1 nicotinate-nucleotide adenylyltransferase [Oliverpabstia sp.]
MKRKIGIMGGTFDPIHIGHLILGEKAYQQFGLEKIMFMPSGNPPHKQHREGRATDEQRVEMVRRAIEDNPHFALSLEEMNADGYSYTYRTLERLKGQNPGVEYYFIIGADSLFDFDGWKEPGRICQAAKLLVAGRNHVEKPRLISQMKYLGEKYNGEFFLLDIPNLDISSKMLRKWISESESILYYVPDSVYTYIKEQKIYK